MKTFIAASLTSILISASMTQTAVAKEHATKRHYSVTEKIRNANASAFDPAAYQPGLPDEAAGSGLVGR